MQATRDALKGKEGVCYAPASLMRRIGSLPAAAPRVLFGRQYSTPLGIVGGLFCREKAKPFAMWPV